VAKRKKGLAAAAASLFHRNYEQIHALDGISFSVAGGEIAGFIGPNGAGKSTAIKIMSGILVPDSGECEVLGTCPWKERSRYVGKIGVVFGQRTQLWWDVPVQDSFDLLRDIYRISEKEYQKNLNELTEVMDLGALLKIPLRQLSLGQRMRCELAASLIHSPQVLFLDEPTIGLDAVSKLAIRKHIALLNKERGITVILTSHDMDDIEALTDRIILIGQGRILHDGSLRSIRERYDTMRNLEILFEGAQEGRDHNGQSPVGRTPIEIEGTRLVSWEEGRAVYEVDTAKISISAALHLLGGKLAIKDMRAADRPIEEIIAALYEDRSI
jgi:ABC-2 type transport system ATP-binding protein